MKEFFESFFGTAYGQFALRYEYSDHNGKDPYGFGFHVDINADLTMPSPYGGMHPWQIWSRQTYDPDYKQAYRWAYLAVQFPKDKEPVRLRPEKTAELLKQRPHHELVTLFQADIPEEAMSRSPHILKQMEYAYRLKRFKSGKLKLIPLKCYTNFNG